MLEGIHHLNSLTVQLFGKFVKHLLTSRFIIVNILVVYSLRSLDMDQYDGFSS